MIRNAGGTGGIPSGNILKMVQNPRMAGSVPAWVRAESAREEIARGLAMAGGPKAEKSSSKSALAYRMQNGEGSHTLEEFGFYDVLDMVNPLQHVPVVSSLYREISGDGIKPIGRIIGGAVFGGASGAAAGLVNLIAEEETGRDIAGNALAFVALGAVPTYKRPSGTPEQRLAEVAGRGIRPPRPGDYSRLND